MSTVEREVWHCDECHFEWMKTPGVMPKQCPRRDCRTRSWNKGGTRDSQSEARPEERNRGRRDGSTVPVLPDTKDEAERLYPVLQVRRELVERGGSDERSEDEQERCEVSDYDFEMGEERRCRLKKGHKGKCQP